jgi:hypothetical protein
MIQRKLLHQVRPHSLDSDGMNNRIPYLYTAIPEHRDVISNAAAFVVRLMTTPADALEMGGTILVREFA